jgi:hypothetical protein
MTDVARATIQQLATELGVSVTQLERILRTAWALGDHSFAFVKDPGGPALYPIEAVKNAIRGAQTLAAVVGADEEATRAIAVATKKSALADKRRAQKKQRQAEGASAKANRRAAREARR